MSETGDGPPAARLGTGRLAGFSDGVFAVAITLLVLEISVPVGSEDDLLGALLDQWPSVAAVPGYLAVALFYLLPIRQLRG